MPAHQFGSVGVFLLRHDRRAGAERIGHPHKAEGLAGPDHEFLRQTRQMQRALAGRGEEIQGEIAVAYRIKAVRGRRGKAQRLRGHIAVDGKPRSRQGRAAERALVEPRPRFGKARHIATYHLVISHQMMAQRHRLRGLQMGEARHDAARVLLRPRHQRALQSGEALQQRIHRIAHPQAEIGRHLVVAAARRVQTTRCRADQFGEPRFGGHVDVFQIPVFGNPVTRVFVRNLLQPGDDRLRIGVAHDIAGRQHGDMGAACRYILFPQAFIEGDRCVNLPHDSGGAGSKPAAPHGIARRGFGGSIRGQIAPFLSSLCCAFRRTAERVR
ncbi:conserved hypothetical protein [Erythrobacter sp. EC-HK427]|nr:conserved hypothetical protein [Erythrobacter sp. EC-HK427]